MTRLALKDGIVIVSYVLSLVSSLDVNKTRKEPERLGVKGIAAHLHHLGIPLQQNVVHFSLDEMVNVSTTPGSSLPPGPLIVQTKTANTTNVTASSKTGGGSSGHEKAYLGNLGTDKNSISYFNKPKHRPTHTFTNIDRNNTLAVHASNTSDHSNHSDTLYFIPKITQTTPPVTSGSSTDDVSNGSTWNLARFGGVVVPATAPIVSNFNAGDVVGIVLGVVTLLLLVLTAVLCIRNRRKRTTSQISYIRQDNMNDKSPLTTKDRDPTGQRDGDEILQDFYEDDLERQLGLGLGPTRLDLRLRREDATKNVPDSDQHSMGAESEARDGGDVEDEFYYDEVFGKSEFTDERTKSAIKDLSITESPDKVPDLIFKHDEFEFDDIFKSRLS